MFKKIDNLFKMWGVTAIIAALNILSIPSDWKKGNTSYLLIDIFFATYMAILTYSNYTRVPKIVDPKTISSCPPHKWEDLGDSTYCSKCEKSPSLE